jgi:tripartite-type tricarboxylate transporter receptor subunit TctC
MALPGVRPEKVKVWRDAFQNTLKDTLFLNEVKSKKLDAEYTSDREMDALAKEMMSQRPEIIERLRKVLGK